MQRLEKNVQQLMRIVKRAEVRRLEDERMLKTLLSTPEEMEMMKATVAALEAESRALSQFDLQFRNLQEALDRMVQHKDQQAEAYHLFRQELLQIRSEMEEVKQLNDDPARNIRTTSSENAVKPRQWLMDSVNEMRSEMDQINRKWNLSGIYQHSQQVQNQIRLIQTEVEELRHEAAEENASARRMKAQLLQLRTDFDQLVADHRQNDNDISQIALQMQSMQSDLPDESGHSGSAGRPPLLRKLAGMETAMESVQKTLLQLQRQIQNSKSAPLNRHQFKTVQNRLDDLDVFYASLQSQVNAVGGLSANVTRSLDVALRLERRQEATDAQVALVDSRCQSQVLPLQSAVETIQFNAAKVDVSVQQLQYKQEETENGLKETRADLLSIGDELERNRMSLLTLQNGAANETLQVCRHDNQHHIIDLKLQSVQQQLTNLQLNVDDLIKDAGSWNAAFLRLISDKKEATDLFEIVPLE